MVEQILAPGVKYSEEADLRPQMLGIGRNCTKRFGGGTEENAVDGPLVLQGNLCNLFRHSKHDMKIRALKKLRFSVLKPLGPSQRLTLWTVTV